MRRPNGNKIEKNKQANEKVKDETNKHQEIMHHAADGLVGTSRQRTIQPVDPQLPRVCQSGNYYVKKDE